MNPLRTVGGRLALALLVVVGGSLAIVYLIVVPLYRSSLVDSRLKDLRHRVEAIADKPRSTRGEVFPSATWIEDEAIPAAEGARVVLFGEPPLVPGEVDEHHQQRRQVGRLEGGAQLLVADGFSGISARHGGVPSQCFGLAVGWRGMRAHSA